MHNIQEPTKAETIEAIEAIVASEETHGEAVGINENRKQRGFSPLTIVTVGLITGANPTAKISSSTLREEEVSRSILNGEN